MSDDDFLRASAVSCQRLLGGDAPAQVRDVSLAIQPGTLTVLCGGADGNLMLRLLGLLEAPDSGEVIFHGAATRALDDAARVEMRNRHFGFMFTEPFLLESLSVAENVAMPLFKLSGTSVEEARAHTERLLAFVGLRDSAGAGGLSLLDQQKVALARALANRPEIIMVENVNAHLAGGDLAEIPALLAAARAHFGVSIIASAASAESLPEADRVITFTDGAISQDTPSFPPAAVSTTGGAGA